MEVVSKKDAFQYIKCAGSARLSLMVRDGEENFNTSNVPVPRLHGEQLGARSDISIHQMCRFRNNRLSKRISNIFISIHQMCRFRQVTGENWKINIPHFNTSNVPVPLALYQCFQCGVFTFQYIKCAGSAVKHFRGIAEMELFQYIKCAGSALKVNVIRFVCVKFQYIKCAGSALLPKVRSEAGTIFQYIKCAGSANKLSDEGMKLIAFQYIKCAGSASICRFRSLACCYFNTSNVPVPQAKIPALQAKEEISIHQMCRFRQKWLPAN